MKPMLYISGPYSAPTMIEREQNIIAAKRRMISALNSGRWWPICPHTHSAGMEIHAPTISHGEWLEIDIQLLSICDALWVRTSPYHNLSSGVALELAWAILAKMPLCIEFTHIYDTRYNAPVVIDQEICTGISVDNGNLPHFVKDQLSEVKSTILEKSYSGEIPDPGTYRGSCLRSQPTTYNEEMRDETYP